MLWRDVWKLAFGVALAAAASACTPATPPATAPAAPGVPAFELTAHEGQTYAGFIAGAGEAFSPARLGLSDAETARLMAAMAQGEPSQLVQGGGAQALVFRGCAAEGCATAEAVMAVDAGGGAFVGVRDAQGADELSPNDPLEALLRLNSPTRSWSAHGA